MMIKESDNLVLQEDLENLVEENELIQGLNNSTVFVTGATGLIGSQVVKALACANRMKGLNIHILAFVRSEEKARRVLGSLVDRKDVVLVTGDINAPIHTEEHVDYIFHGASATSSRYFVTNPVETITTALEGTKHILEFARKKQIRSMVYLSSLEVYGVPQTESGYVTESDYGYIEPLSIRSSYSEGKRMVECLCASYAAEYEVPVKIARLSQTFGAGVEYQDGRVFAEFARCAVEQKNIVLHTQGNTLRTYCYTKDAVSALIYILLSGNTGEAYNVTNKNTAVTIREMAQCVCDTFPDSHIQVEFDMPEDITSFGYNPEMVIRLDCTKLEKLGWKATVDLQEMFIRLVRSF